MSNRITTTWSSFGKKIAFTCLLCTVPGLTEAQTLVSAPAAQGFGQVAVNSSAPASQTLSYLSSGAVVPVFSLAYGTEYTLGSSKCTGSGNVSCTVSVGFQPHWPGLREDAVLVKDRLGNVIATTLLYGTGLGSQVALYPGIISTIAGTPGVWGYSGDRGPATGAVLSNPQGIATDNLGNLYIADSINQVVRQVSATTGQISTIAGSGAAAYTGDGGPAVKAALNTPVAVALDGAGNVYIADQGNNVIRKVSAATQQITTVAGGGTAASGPDGLGDGGFATNGLLWGPNDVALDGAGNLYIADSFDNLIRRVDAASGIITVVASTGLHNPTGVALDAGGNLFIADSGNSIVRRVDASSGTMTVAAGTGAYGYSGDLGAATGAKLGSPVSVRLDAAGNLYIVDQAKNVIRQVNAQSGIITTIVGTGAPGFFGDGGNATGAALKNPTGVGLDSAGNIYVADYANNVIRKVSRLSGMAFPSTLVGEASPLQTLTVLNIGNQSLNFAGLIISPNFSQQSLGGANCSSSATLAAGGICTITLDFVPTTSGNLSGSLTLTENSLNAASTTQSVTLTGTGTGGAVPQLYFSPAGLTFAAQALGISSGAQSITLSNSGTAALNISSILLGGANAADFSISTSCQSVLAAKASCSTSLVFSPTGAGSRTASLTFVDNLANSPQTVMIAGTGAAPQIALSSNAFVFGSQPVGSTSTANTMTISNIGSAPLNVLSVALAGANAADFSMTTSCGSAVPAGASCSVSISFSPNGLGLRTASFTITDNASGSIQTVAVTGAGGFDDAGTHYYAGADQHVHELYIAAGAWRDRDLTASTQGPEIEVGSSIVTVFDTSQNLLRINYGGADQHVHEIYTAGGAWYDCDLTAAAHGPNTAALVSVANLLDTAVGTIRINYAAADQHMHELYIGSGAWHDCDLTAAAGGPNLAASSSIANLFDTTNTLRINYAGADQHLHELYISGGAWRDCDLTAAAGGPNLAPGAAVANLIDTLQNTLRINYAGADQHLHELYISGGAWHDCDLTVAARAPNLAAGASIGNFVDTIQNILRINYAATDQHVHELYIGSSAWHDCDLTAAAGALNVAGGVSIENVVDVIENMLRINYAGADQHIHELYVGGNAWRDCDLTASAGGSLTLLIR